MTARASAKRAFKCLIDNRTGRIVADRQRDGAANASINRELAALKRSLRSARGERLTAGRRGAARSARASILPGLTTPCRIDPNDNKRVHIIDNRPVSIMRYAADLLSFGGENYDPHREGQNSA